MRPIRAPTLICFLLSGVVSACAAGLSVALLALGITTGLAGLVVGIFLGFEALGPALKVATLPAILLGGLLWTAEIRQWWVWAGTGAGTGLAAYAFLFAVPVDSLVPLEMFRDAPALFALIFAVSGALAAWMFRASMQVLTLLGSVLAGR